MTMITAVLLHCMKYQSIQMMKHIFNKYNNQIEMICFDLETTVTGKKSTLLIEAMKTEQDEVIQLVLNHPKMNRKIINMLSNEQRRNALHMACYCYNVQLPQMQRLSTKTIELMIEKGIDINATCTYKNWIPLEVAKQRAKIVGGEEKKFLIAVKHILNHKGTQ